MRNIKAAGGIIIQKDTKKIAIVSQFGEQWVFPKGKQDNPEEDLIETAKREITEETGLTELTLIKELGSYEYISQGKHQFNNEPIIKTLTLFLFTTTQTELKPQDPHNPEAKWIDEDEVETYLTPGNQLTFYQKIKNNLKFEI